MQGQSRLLLLGLGAGIGVAAVALAIWYKKRNSVPKKWKKIGELSDMMCFPIKSCGPIREKEMDCEILGLKKGFLRDRVFMVIKSENGRFITGRAFPHMTQIIPEIKDNILTLKAPGMMDQEVDIKLMEEKSAIRAEVWGEHVPCIDCGEEVARWLSRYIITEDSGLRLVYYPFKLPCREAHKKHTSFPNIIQVDSGSFPDATGYMLINESSVADLNTRLERIVTPQHFRPNFVLKGAEQYGEDHWDWIKIGNDVIFRCVKPCTRCIFTTIDPETGIKDKNMEPLKTLKTYRQITDPKLRPATGDSPVMGVHLGLRRKGVVKLGDPIFINA